MLSRHSGAVLALALALPAQLPSGPEPGTPLPQLMVYASSGPHAGKTFDAAAAIGSAPGVLLFVHELTRNTAPMIGGLDRFAIDYGMLGLRAFTVRIAADRTEAEAGIKRSSDAMRLRNPIVVSVDGAEGPGAYALNRKCTLTLVACKDGKVQRSVGLTDTGRADLPKLREAIEAVTGAMPQDEAALKTLLEERLPQDAAALRQMAVQLAVEVQRLRREAEQKAANDAQMRRDRQAAGGAESRPQARPAAGREAPAREGGPPEDEQLVSLLRQIIRPEASADALSTAFKSVETRIGEDAGLRKQAVEMFKLVQRLGYASDEAKRRAKEWVEQHK